MYQSAAGDQVFGDSFHYKCLTISAPRNAFVTICISTECLFDACILWHIDNGPVEKGWTAAKSREEKTVRTDKNRSKKRSRLGGQKLHTSYVTMRVAAHYIQKI